MGINEFYQIPLNLQAELQGKERRNMGWTVFLHHTCLDHNPENPVNCLPQQLWDRLPDGVTEFKTKPSANGSTDMHWFKSKLEGLFQERTKVLTRIKASTCLLSGFCGCTVSGKWNIIDWLMYGLPCKPWRETAVSFFNLVTVANLNLQMHFIIYVFICSTWCNYPRETPTLPLPVSSLQWPEFS